MTEQQIAKKLVEFYEQTPVNKLRATAELLAGQIVNGTTTKTAKNIMQYIQSEYDV